MSVKVGVRVRPFNPREMSLNCGLCVDMIGNMTRLIDPHDPENKHRDFTFDYSFWSHDQFQVEESGYFRAENQRYADQQNVFEKVGLEILQNAWEGYHCCLFAYGQTGSGKSYSMVGYGANKGIVPISCEQIFTRISKNQDSNKEYEVQISMMEIYNEKVQDLLIPISKRPKEGHKIREHKTLGIYVEGMSKHFVDTYEAIQKKMEQGGRNRSIAATQMNASSSRAHTIISIEFKQTQVCLANNKKKEKLSVIHLVDLAGSEKVGKTGATGDRLKEAAGINKSLSVLGLVISALAEKSTGKGKGHVVPYRDSCLTRILQNALGGNSKTLMICAISPASDNYEQTLSTLRYADQAKKIQNKAVVNESETDKLIRTLTQERQELRLKLQKMQEMYKHLMLSPSELEERMEAQAQLKFISQKQSDYEMSKKQRRQSEQFDANDIYCRIDMTKPHIANLNQDPQLSRKVNYAIDQDEIKIGKRNSQPKNNIEIGGMGIRQLHAIIKRIDGYFYLHPEFYGEDSNCYLNGDLVLKEEQIFHLDRISFGTNNIFLIILPQTEPRISIDQKLLDWEYAQNELFLKKQLLQKELNEQKQKKIRQETENLLKDKQNQLLELQKSLEKSLAESQEARLKFEAQKESQFAQLQNKILQEQNKIAQKQKQIENNKKKMKDDENQQKQKTKQKYYYQRKLLKTLPKCIQLNLIAKEFKRNVSMSVKMMLANEDDDQEDFQMTKRTIVIKVVNKDVGYSYWWDVETLSNRYYIIKDLSQQYFQTGVIPTMDISNDPFWDPMLPTLIGRGFLTTKSLAYMFDNPATLPIIGEDEHCGQLVVNLIPTDETGVRNLCEQMDEEEVQFQPEQLLEKPLHFIIKITSAKIPINYQDIYVEYEIKTDQQNKQSYKTTVIHEKTNAPYFGYQKLHKFNKVSENMLKYITKAKIIFKVFGCEMVMEEKKITKTTKSYEGVEPDVQKARKGDLQKQQNTITFETQPTNKTISNSKPVSSVPVQPRRQPAPAATQPTKPAGTTTKNTINDRNQKNAKEKDCIIY